MYKIRHFQKHHEDFRRILRYLTNEGIRQSCSKRANGATVVSVTTPEGLVISGWSVCHWKDTFKKKQGIYEALKKIKEAFPNLAIELPPDPNKIKKVKIIPKPPCKIEYVHE